MKRSGYPKVMNAYANAVSFYAEVPKAVWAALAISALTSGGERLDEVERRVAREWRILHENGIVAQAPPATVRRYDTLPLIE